MGAVSIDRRCFLGSMVFGGAASLTFLAATPSLAGTIGRPAYICALKDRHGFGVAVLTSEGEILRRESLPDRAHGAAISPDGKTAVIIARRPGYYIAVMDLTGVAPFTVLPVRDDRLFYGHGFFAPDGKLFFATENDFENERGVLGIYDASDRFQRVGEYSAGGVGPHEAILMRDGRIAVVANGGIITHPDYPREKLNLASMDPTLAYLDIATGEALAVQRLPRELYQMSFRHLAEDGDGTIWIGGQYEGPAGDDVPMVFVSTAAGGVSVVHAPTAVYRNMRHYVGSVATDFRRGLIATTCPRGGVWQIWDASARRLVEERLVPDVCGVAAGPQDFVAVDGHGGVTQGRSQLAVHDGLAWDNHLLTINRNASENDNHS